MISVAANDTHTFGLYKCVVNNSVATMETSLLIQQKGDKVVDCYILVYYNTGHIIIEILREARVGTCSSCPLMKVVLSFLSSGKLQVVLDLKSSSHCDSSDVSTQLRYYSAILFVD